MKSHAIHWKCNSTGRIGTGTALFAQEEAERLAAELNQEYPDIDHEAVSRALPFPESCSQAQNSSSANSANEGYPMNFTDTQLQACFERNLAEGTAATSSLNQVGALIATHDWFSMVEGAHSTRVHETIDLLLSPGLRAGLRDWYGQPDTELNPKAIQFRNHLSRLAGEKFGNEAVAQKTI